MYDIKEIRIEGHTSSEWIGEADKNIAYMNNMKLPQERARSILKYVMFGIPGSEQYDLWARPLVTANGLSSSKWLAGADEVTEDAELSRPVPATMEKKLRQRISPPPLVL